MTDREMLELAAKAAGLGITWEPVHGCHWINPGQGLQIDPWEPLKDDGQALRLAAKLKIDIEWQATHTFPTPRVEAYQRNDEGPCFCADEPEENYRRAIVRAAAELGKAMP